MPMRIMRYGDVLLMYAEAKMEMNQIDQSVFDALNALRARAYKCGINETSKYPAITEANQTKLRRIIRNERRIELAWENRRWFDLIRWRVCEEALTMPCYGVPANATRKANEKTPYWFFPEGFKPRMTESSPRIRTDVHCDRNHFHDDCRTDRICNSGHHMGNHEDLERRCRSGNVPQQAHPHSRCIPEDT